MEQEKRQGRSDVRQAGHSTVGGGIDAGPVQARLCRMDWAKWAAVTVTVAGAFFALF